MAKIILQLKDEGMTVLISEQNLHFAQIVADIAVIIEAGSTKYVGTFADLDAQPEIRDAYLAV
jgi:branched-chain amino acid transport system ATP-binding protein